MQWPDRRADVLNGLDALAAEPNLDCEGQDQRWPDLSNAVHWVVDDTFWDQADAAQSIGTLLVDVEEAEAVGAVVALVLDVSARVGSTATDADWCSDSAWPRLQRAARDAATLLRTNSA